MINNANIKSRNRKIQYTVLHLLDFVQQYKPELLTFPLDVEAIISLLPQYKAWTYSYHSKLFNQSITQTENFCQSKTGCSICNDKNQYIILYNDTMPLGRQRFTLAHELGHCLISHFASLKNIIAAENNINADINTAIEAEADSFAATLLCPFPVCKKLNISSPLDMQNIFGLSCEASEYQYSKYSKWKSEHFKTAFDADVVRYFNAFFTTNFAKGNTLHY